MAGSHPPRADRGLVESGLDTLVRTGVTNPAIVVGRPVISLGYQRQTVLMAGLEAGTGRSTTSTTFNTHSVRQSGLDTP